MNQNESNKTNLVSGRLKSSFLGKSNKLSPRELMFKYSIFLVLVVLIIIFSCISPKFLGAANIGNFLRQIPTVGIFTVAITMILITGGVDLSIGAIAAFAGTTAAYMAVHGYNPVIVILACLAIGALWGMFNGVLITKFKLEPFILTMGTSYLIRGLILFFTNGIYIKGTPDWFYSISNTTIGSNLIHSNTVIFILLAIIMAFVMKNTRFGRYSYAVGSNKEAARLSGINVDKHYIKVFVIEGIFAALAGLLLMSNLNVGAPNEANGIDLFAMAAAIIGGAQFGGGIGTIGGAMVGILTIQVFQNGLAILGVNTFIQQAVTGGIIVVAVIVDFYRKRSTFKTKG